MKLQRSLTALILSALTLARAASITRQELQENRANGLRLLSFAADDEPVWMTEDQKLDVIRSEANFFDLTDTYDFELDQEENRVALKAAGPASADESDGIVNIFAYPSGPAYQSAVKPIINTLSISNLQSYLNNLTTFNNRYYRAQSGADAAVWIYNTVQTIAGQNPSTGASVALFNNTFLQPSVIARFPGRNTSAPLTILGAHLDSIASSNPTSGRAPGADDDGSGTVDLIEAFRALAAAGFAPATPVEFHWYAGEEGGLLGSQAISANYKSAGKQVKAMLQLDMTAYTRPGNVERVGFVPDFTDSSLTAYLGTLVAAYCAIPSVVGPPCGYACSDHGSWNKQGYPSAFPFEAPYGSHSTVIHTSSDTVNATGFSWTHMLEFAKLAVAYAYELGVNELPDHEPGTGTGDTEAVTPPRSNAILGACPLPLSLSGLVGLVALIL